MMCVAQYYLLTLLSVAAEQSSAGAAAGETGWLWPADDDKPSYRLPAAWSARSIERAVDRPLGSPPLRAVP